MKKTLFLLLSVFAFAVSSFAYTGGDATHFPINVSIPGQGVPRPTVYASDQVEIDFELGVILVKATQDAPVNIHIVALDGGASQVISNDHVTVIWLPATCTVEYLIDAGNGEMILLGTRFSE